MKNKFVLSGSLLLAACLPWKANAATFSFSFLGPGVNGTVQLTYGAATDSTYPQAFEVTSVSGTFSDFNNGLNIINAQLGTLQAIKHDMPDMTNLLAPHNFTRYAVASGLAHGSLSFDNLFYPGGSPPTSTDYQIHGGFLDIYGLLFDIGGGRSVNIWSNGDFTMTGQGPIDYGVAVVTTASAMDYVEGGVSITPEPSALALLATAVLGMLWVWRRRVTH